MSEQESVDVRLTRAAHRAYHQIDATRERAEESLRLAEESVRRSYRSRNIAMGGFLVASVAFVLAVWRLDPQIAVGIAFTVLPLALAFVAWRWTR